VDESVDRLQLAQYVTDTKVLEILGEIADVLVDKASPPGPAMHNSTKFGRWETGASSRDEIRSQRRCSPSFPWKFICPEDATRVFGVWAIEDGSAGSVIVYKFGQ